MESSGEGGGGGGGGKIFSSQLPKYPTIRTTYCISNTTTTTHVLYHSYLQYSTCSTTPTYALDLRTVLYLCLCRSYSSAVPLLHLPPGVVSLPLSPVWLR